jgi:starvation-inducible DNA-binding protein
LRYALDRRIILSITGDSSQKEHFNMAKHKSHQTSIDLDAAVREPMIALLNQQLADTFDLFSQTKQAHWNVKGMQFFQLHELYDKLAEELVEFVDLIAERATALGGAAAGTTRMAADATRLPEFPLVVGSQESIQALVERFAMLGKSTREAIDRATDAGDLDTADIFTEISRALDKALYFLESHLQE